MYSIECHTSNVKGYGSLLFFRRRPEFLAYAAMPLFAFWTFIVTVIWLLLLGLSHVARGHYTAIEIALTLLMAAFSIVGGIRAFSVGRPLRPLVRALTFVLFAATQVVALMLSRREPFANR